MSPYYLLSEFPREKTEKILNKNDVLMFRTGLRDILKEKIMEEKDDTSVILEGPLQGYLTSREMPRKSVKTKQISFQESIR